MRIQRLLLLGADRDLPWPCLRRLGCVNLEHALVEGGRQLLGVGRLRQSEAALEGLLKSLVEEKRPVLLLELLTYLRSSDGGAGWASKHVASDLVGTLVDGTIGSPTGRTTPCRSWSGCAPARFAHLLESRPTAASSSASSSGSTTIGPLSSAAAKATAASLFADGGGSGVSLEPDQARHRCAALGALRRLL
jgi:hypothetical protein